MKHLRWLAFVAALGMGAAACLPTGLPPTPSRRILLVGDSLTQQYGPYAARELAANNLGASFWGTFGDDPVNNHWADDVREWVGYWHPSDVVIQDYALVGIVPDNVDLETYELALNDVVFAAKSQGARVTVLVGCCYPDFFRSLPADAFLDMVPADAGDGIHYLPAGAAEMGDQVCVSLNGGNPCVEPPTTTTTTTTTTEPPTTTSTTAPGP